MAPLTRGALPGPTPRPARQHRHYHQHRRQRRLRRFLIPLMLLVAIATGGAYLLFFQVELLSWIIVGLMLTVVFGTPLLCVVGLFLIYVRAMARIGQARSGARAPIVQRTTSAPQTIVVSEVVFDD